MICFPISNLLNEQTSYNFLSSVLHPEGLRCKNGHPLLPGQLPHNYNRAPLVNYRCQQCGNVFNLFTNTVWQGTHYSCSTIVLVMRGIAQGTPTRQLADELNLDYGTLLENRHKIQKLGFDNQPHDRLSDEVTEADEMFQNAGEKGTKHDDPNDPPRYRANRRRGIGTMENDRPPIIGVVGRTSGQIHLTVGENTQQTTVQSHVEATTQTTSILNTDESRAYSGIGREHHTVCHSRHEYARDEDGDGFCEVHCNTMEGIWTGLRNFLRPFRGVHKKYLASYVAMFEWAHNLKRVTDNFLRALMIPNFTYLPI
jgi:transposase-like protein